MKQHNIQISDLPEVDEITKSTINEAVLTTYKKLQRIIKSPNMLALHFKQHEIEGKRRKYSVHARFNFSGRNAICSETGWDLLKVLQKALHGVERSALKEIGKA